MSLTLPPFAYPALWFYNLEDKWPGVDEDAVVDFGKGFAVGIETVDTYADELFNILGELGEMTKTEVFVAISETFEEDVAAKLQPWLDGLAKYVPWACETVHDIVLGAKTVILSALVTNIAADIPFLLAGQFWWLAAKKMAIKALLDPILDAALIECVESLTAQGQKIIETFWLDDQKEELVKTLVERVTSIDAVEASLESGALGAGVTQLETSEAEILMSCTRLCTATETFLKAWNGVEEQSKLADFLDKQIPGSSPLVATAVKEMILWGVDQVTSFVKTLANEIYKKLVEMLEKSQSTISDAENKALQAALELIEKLEQTRPVGTATSDEGPPDFYAGVRASIGAGSADSDETPGATVRPTVNPTRPAGSATANPTDISVLDASSTDVKGAGTAQSDEEAPDMDVSVLDV